MDLNIRSWNLGYGVEPDLIKGKCDSLRTVARHTCCNILEATMEYEGRTWIFDTTTCAH